MRQDYSVVNFWKLKALCSKLCLERLDSVSNYELIWACAAQSFGAFHMFSYVSLKVAWTLGRDSSGDEKRLMDVKITFTDISIALCFLFGELNIIELLWFD